MFGVRKNNSMSIFKTKILREGDLCQLLYKTSPSNESKKKNPPKTRFSFSQVQPYSVTSHFTYDEKLLVKASLILQM